jgi:hypothetical protein
MSQLEDSPAELLQRFSNNLVGEMGELEEDDLARQLVLAVVTIVDAAAMTAAQMEQEEQRNESA